jgi:hypothetical protein
MKDEDIVCFRIEDKLLKMIVWKDKWGKWKLGKEKKVESYKEKEDAVKEAKRYLLKKCEEAEEEIIRKGWKEEKVYEGKREILKRIMINEEEGKEIENKDGREYVSIEKLKNCYLIYEGKKVIGLETEEGKVLERCLEIMKKKIVEKKIGILMEETVEYIKKCGDLFRWENVSEI